MGNKSSGRLGTIAGAGGPPEVITAAVVNKKLDFLVCTTAGTLTALFKWNRSASSPQVDVLAAKNYAGFSFSVGDVIPAGDGFYITEVTPGTGEFLGYPHKDLP